MVVNPAEKYTKYSPWQSSAVPKAMMEAMIDDDGDGGGGGGDHDAGGGGGGDDGGGGGAHVFFMKPCACCHQNDKTPDHKLRLDNGFLTTYLSLKLGVGMMIPVQCFLLLFSVCSSGEFSPN